MTDFVEKPPQADDERIERAAEAMWKIWGLRGAIVRARWVGEGEHTREMWRIYARAAIAAVFGRAAERRGNEAELDRLRVLATKVDAIRNSIVGVQGFNWSEHAYPLVAALDEAGYPGVGYEDARESVGTLIERTNAAEALATTLLARAEKAEAALRPFAKLADEWDRWQRKGSTSTPRMIQVSYGRCTIGLPEYQAARAPFAPDRPGAERLTS